MSVGIKTIGSEKVTINGEKVKERLNLKKNISIVQEEKTQEATNSRPGEIIQIAEDAFVYITSRSTKRYGTIKYDSTEDKIYISNIGTVSDNDIFASGFKENKFYRIYTYYNSEFEIKCVTYTGDFLNSYGKVIETVIGKAKEYTQCFCTTEEQNEFYIISSTPNIGSSYDINLFDKKTQSMTLVARFEYPGDLYPKMAKYKNSIYMLLKQNDLYRVNLEKNTVTLLFKLKEKLSLDMQGISMTVCDKKLMFTANKSTTNSWESIRFLYDIEKDKISTPLTIPIKNGKKYVDASFILDKYGIYQTLAESGYIRTILMKDVYEKV